MKSLLAEIAQALTEITPDQILRARSMLRPPEPHEKHIITIEDPEAQRLWTLAIDYERRYKLHLHTARFDTSTDEERNVLLYAAARLSKLEDVVRDLAWIRMQDLAVEVTSETVITGTQSFAMRENFSLVSTTPEEDPLQGMQTIPIPLPKELFNSLLDAFRKRRTTEEEPEPKDNVKRKPQ